MDDVMPFLENVTRGRNVPARAPARRRASLRALRRRQPDQRPEPRADRGARARAARARRRPAGLLRQPQLAAVPHRHDAADARRRRRRALAVFTSAFSSYSAAAASIARISSTRSRRSATAHREVPRRRACSSTIPASSRRTSSVCATRSRELPAAASHIAFTAHSIPVAMARNCAYEAQLAESGAARRGRRSACTDWARRLPEPQRPAAGAVARARHLRSPRATSPSAASQSVGRLADSGFVSDHLEVLLRPRRRGAGDAPTRLGLRDGRARRRGTATHPAFVAGLARPDRRAFDAGRRPQPSVGRVRGEPHDVCAPDCCLPRQRAARARWDRGRARRSRLRRDERPRSADRRAARDPRAGADDRARADRAARGRDRQVGRVPVGRRRGVPRERALRRALRRGVRRHRRELADDARRRSRSCRRCARRAG